MKTFVTLSLAAALISGCTRPANHGPASAAPLPVARVHVVTARLERVPFTTEVTGTVRPVQRAQLAAKVMGAIGEMPITLGQRVGHGDVLVKISAGEINARVARAQSQLNAARRDFERERDLLAKGASTADMVRGLEDRLAAAQAMVREAEVMLGYATIRAPFDGVVARKLASAGDLASPGLPLLELEGITGFEVESGIPDSLASALTTGSGIAVEIPVAGVALTGKLAEVSSAADAAARTVTVKIALPGDAAVRSGQFVRVRLPAAPADALLIPRAAVAAVGQMERAFVAGSDNRAVLRLVKTGARQGDRIEILAGLDDGERVVVPAPIGLREGQPLEIQP